MSFAFRRREGRREGGRGGGRAKPTFNHDGRAAMSLSMGEVSAKGALALSSLIKETCARYR